MWIKPQGRHACLCIHGMLMIFYPPPCPITLKYWDFFFIRTINQPFKYSSIVSILRNDQCFKKMVGLVVQQRYTTSGYSVKGFESLMQWYTLSIFLKWSQLWIFIPLYSLWAKKKRLWDRGLEKLKMLLTFFFWWLKKLSYLYMYREKTNCSTLKWITVKQK